MTSDFLEGLDVVINDSFVDFDKEILKLENLLLKDKIKELKKKTKKTKN